MRGRRGGGDRDRGREDRRTISGRPRKTQEELDQEMEDYWGDQKKDEAANGVVTNGGSHNGNVNGFGAPAAAAAPEVVMDDGDIDMIE